MTTQKLGAQQELMNQENIFLAIMDFVNQPVNL